MLYVSNTRGGHAQLFLSPQSQFRNLKEALPQSQFRNFFKEMLLRNRNSAIPQSQFFLMSATSSLQLESFISAIFGIFLAVESGWGSFLKIGGKKSHATVPLRQVSGFQRNRQFKKYLLSIFKPSFINIDTFPFCNFKFGA